MEDLPIPEIQQELGRRLRRYRLQQDLSQDHVAQRSAISTRTLRSLEQGQDVHLSTLLRVLSTLGRLDALDAFLPPPKVSPLEYLQAGLKERKRASKGTDDRR
jgi:transcriptional regulator with XRE-family HTH domain